jgi:hypothetical protein
MAFEASGVKRLGRCLCRQGRVPPTAA